MSAKLQFRIRRNKSSKGTSKRARGSPPNPPRPENGAAYGLFRACGVDVRDGTDLKAGLLRVLEERPLDLIGKCCDPKDMAHVRYTLQCDRQEALLDLYRTMRLSGKDEHDGILDWDPAIGGLVQYLRQGSHFAALKLCEKEERSHWGKTVSLQEELPNDGHDEDSSRTLLETLAAKPEPGVCVCGRY